MVVSILVLLASLLIAKMDSARANAETTTLRATLTTVREAFTGSSNSSGYVADMKHVPLFNPVQIQLRDLLDPSRYPAAAAYDPVAQRGWRGPYLDNVQSVLNTDLSRRGLFPAADDRRSSDDATFLDRHFYETASNSFYGAAGDRTAADPWGNPIVVQVPPASAFDSSTPEKRFQYARIVSAGPDGILDTPRDRLAGMQPEGTTEARGDDLVIFLSRQDVYEPE